MRTFRRILTVIALILALPLAVNAATRVLIVTGGHPFETNQFFKLFADNTNITFKAVEDPGAHEMFKPEHAGEYDVVVLYDMWKDITPDAQKNFEALIKNGKGLLSLHHSICGYQTNWPEYERIIGGKYHEGKWIDNGVQKPGSSFKQGVDVSVKVAASPHPVTSGIKDYTIHDEVYKGLTVQDGVTPLLTTEEPASGSPIAWAKTYGKGRVVFIQHGHDHLAWENPALRKLIAQAIEWTAGK